MSTERNVTIEIDTSAIIFLFGVFALIVLCLGEPDLLDAIIAWIARQP